MTVYRSKVDAWLVIVVTAVMVLCFVPIVVDEFSWVALAIGVAATAAVLSTLFSIKYAIDGDRLVVTCLWFLSDTFPISKITSVRSTRTFLSAPAASLDRLAIRCGRRSVVVSPRSKCQFVGQLLAVNPAISVEI